MSQYVITNKNHSDVEMTTRKKRVRFTLDINFGSEAEKDAFSTRLSAVREQLTPRGAHVLNNLELMQALFSLASSSSTEEGQQCPSSGSFLRNSG